jgi:solute carrier family 35 protein E1
LNALDFPWTIATIQMATGIAYFVPLWLLGIRKAPKLSGSDLKTLFPIALCHTGVHVGAVIALGAGAVSFAHIVKASEPVVTCGLNALLLGQILPLPVYLTLLPIIGGVAIASMKELSFTMLALASAMLSNVSSAARGVLSKKTMSGKQIGENLDAQNLYAVLTAMSTLILIPAMLAMEGTGFFTAFKAAVDAGTFTSKSLASIVAFSGATYYAYNEVAFLALGKVNPVTHAVGNTIKRVVIIVASVIAFKTPMSTGSVIGSSIAIFGTLLYSLAMNASKK